MYYENFNVRRIEIHNVFNHYRFWEDCVKNKKKNKDNREAFEEQLKKDLAYYYWSKCEWEIILSAWPPRKDFDEKKIDVFDQICLNWDKFADYVWENRKDIRKEIK